MKTKSRIFATLLVVLTLVSAVSIPALAANTQDETFSNYEIYIDGNFLPPREKEDASPHYLYITGGNMDVVYVFSHGLETYSNWGDNNLTKANGQFVDFVTCRKGTRYSISNGVYEAGCPWAALGILRADSWWGGVIDGKWSPDSTGRYTYAVPEEIPWTDLD